MSPTPTPTAPPAATDPSLDLLVEAALPAVRVVVGLAARSLEASPVPITLAQYRMLVLLAEGGARGPAAIANILGVEPSTITRMCDRLVRDRLVVRRSQPSDRRTVNVALTPLGRRTVAAIQRRRREAFGRLLEAIPRARRSSVVAALQELAAADAETTQPSWLVGWLA